MNGPYYQIPEQEDDSLRQELQQLHAAAAPVIDADALQAAAASAQRSQAGASLEEASEESPHLPELSPAPAGSGEQSQEPHPAEAPGQ